MPSVNVSELEAQERYNDKYVILYDFRNLGMSSPLLQTLDSALADKRLCIDLDEATAEFTALLDDLEAVGLHTEVRPGFYQTLLVFVKAPRELLGNAVYKER